MKILTIFLSLFLFSTVCSAKEELEYSRQYELCMDRSGGATMPMVDCTWEENKRQDRKLNELYKKLMVSLPPEKQKELKQVQLAWIKYKDLNCDFYYDRYSGSSTHINASSCYLETTASRVKDLEWLEQHYRDMGDY